MRRPLSRTVRTLVGKAVRRVLPREGTAPVAAPAPRPTHAAPAPTPTAKPAPAPKPTPTPTPTPRPWTVPADTAQASFVAHVQQTRRRYRAIKGRAEVEQHPMRLLPDKLRTYDLARSLGVPVPELLGRWERADDVDLTDLPDLPEVFVLKATRGAGSKAVFPLERVGEDGFRLVSGSDVMEADVVRTLMRDRELESLAQGPWFAEAFIGDPAQGLPHDVKVYAFYGVIGQVLVRSVGRHGDQESVRRSYYDEHGTLLGRVSPLASPEPVPPPPDLEALCAIARTMSRAVSLPFVRVDLYSTATGPVLGELTLAPGGKQLYRREHDRRLGQLWEDAATRMEVDLLRDRTAELIAAKKTGAQIGREGA